MPQFFWQTTTALTPPVPTFVHADASDLNDNNGIVGNNFVFNAPNASPVGNCLILAVAYPFSAGRTRAISDSTGATWSTPIVTGGTASAGHLNLALYVLPNVSAAQHILTFTFDAEVKPFWHGVFEFYNVAAASPADGSASQVVAGPNISTTSFTTTADNDLIFACAISDDTVGTNVANQASAMSATGGASLIHANNVCTIPSISSYFVQPSHGAINPGFSITQSSGTNFVCAAIALKAGASGSDLPAGIKLRKILHYSIVNPQTGNNKILFPRVGKFPVATMAAGSDLNVVNSVVDSLSNTYTARATAGNSQFFDPNSGNIAASDGYFINMNLNAGEAQFSLHLWDVEGAAASPFDRMAGFNGSAPSSTTFNDFPDITPLTAPGLTIVQTGFGTASQGSLASGSPAGASFDCISYTTSAPLFDQDRIDNADQFGHAYYSTTAAQTWNWHITSDSFGSTAFATACTYKSA